MRPGDSLAHVGERYGSRTVLGADRARGSHLWWLMRCDCGDESYVRVDTIERATRCKPCSKRKYHGYKHLSAIIVRRFETLRRSTEHELNVTLDDLDAVWVSQDGRCALTGLMLDEDTMSLDRIDSAGGYTRGNIQWLHKNVNIMKNKFDQDAFISICLLVARQAKIP